MKQLLPLSSSFKVLPPSDYPETLSFWNAHPWSLSFSESGQSKCNPFPTNRSFPQSSATSESLLPKMKLADVLRWNAKRYAYLSGGAGAPRWLGVMTRTVPWYSALHSLVSASLLPECPCQSCLYLWTGASLPESPCLSPFWWATLRSHIHLTVTQSFLHS